MLATANTGEIGRCFRKNAGEWTGRVEIGKEEIPGSKRGMFVMANEAPSSSHAIKLLHLQIEQFTAIDCFYMEIDTAFTSSFRGLLAIDFLFVVQP